MSKFVRHVKNIDLKISPKLGQLDIELTERCNNNCIHCSINLPENDLKSKAREMSTGQVKNILKEAVSLGCMQVRFTGGEPLLRKDFEELYVCARKLGLKVPIFTNARLITAKLAELFSRIPPRVPIEVTVYGMHKDSYEAVSRVSGSFTQFKRGVDFLNEFKIPFVVKSAILPQNKHEIEEFENWAGTIPWMDKKPSYSMFFDLRNRRDDNKKNELIKSMRLTPVDGLKMLLRDSEKYHKSMEEFAEKFMGSTSDLLFRCGAGNSLCIDAYGFAQPCMTLRMPELTVKITDEEMHNYREGGKGGNNLYDVLNIFKNGKGSYLPLCELKATNPEYLKRCAVCFLKGLCEQCPAKSWIEHGTLDTPVEYFCEVAHAQARWLGWLKPDEKAWEVKNGKLRLQNKSAHYCSHLDELSLSNTGQLELLKGMVERGLSLRTMVRGFSMQPFIRDKDIITLAPLNNKELEIGDIAAFESTESGKMSIHRIIGQKGSFYLFKGDNAKGTDGFIKIDQIVARVTRIERNDKEISIGLGPEKIIIAILNRGSGLLYLKRLRGISLRPIHFILKNMQDIKLYRKAGRQFIKNSITVEIAGEGDFEKLHKGFISPSNHQDNLSFAQESWVAKKNKQIIGFITLVNYSQNYRPWTGHWLFSLYIRERFRGFGIGEKLTERVIEEAHSQDAKVLSLVVNEDNFRAVALYKKLGFSHKKLPDLEEILIKEKEKTGRRRIVMQKKLG